MFYWHGSPVASFWESRFFNEAHFRVPLIYTQSPFRSCAAFGKNFHKVVKLGVNFGIRAYNLPDAASEEGLEAALHRDDHIGCLGFVGYVILLAKTGERGRFTAIHEGP
jgi:hypothetical protein